MIKCYLNKPIEYCQDFDALNIDWEFVFKNPRFSAKARERRRKRGTNKFPKIYRLVRILSEIDIDILRGCLDVEWCEEEQPDELLYNPNDPQGLIYSWTKQTLTHATNQTAFDIEKGDGIVVGIIESAGNGANYTDSEIGGTGNQANDWAAIQAGTHAKFVNYTNPLGQSINPYGTGHGNGVCRQAISVMDNAVAYCGSCPNGKVMMAVGQNFDEAIQRMADLGIDVISVSYTNVYSHRTAIQYAVAAGVIVVYAHGANSHTELSVPPFEAILVGQFSLTDVSELSYGIGLTVISRGPIGSGESYSTPATAGICGLLLALNPTWNIYDVWSALIQVCQKPTGMGGQIWHKEYGWGIPDAYAALQLTQAQLKPLPVIDLTIATAAFGIQLSWNNLPTTNFDHFEVRRKLNSMPSNETDGTLVYSGTEENYYDKLALSGNWYYAVWGVNSNGNYSPYVAVTDFYTKKNITYTAPVPIITDISATFNDITLTWQAISGAVGYKVYWDTDSGAPYTNSQDVGDVTEYTIGSLTPGETYYLVLTASDDEGNETFSDEQIVVTTVIYIPTIATVVATNITITMTWQAISGAVGYKVYWDTDSGAPYTNSQDVGNVTEYTLSSLTPGETYYLALTAYDMTGYETPYSVERNIGTIPLFLLTELQADISEYSYILLVTIRNILYANRAVLKAGTKSIEDRIYYGLSTSIPETPAIQIEGLEDRERHETQDPGELLEFNTPLWFYHINPDIEAGELEIHQLGDRIKEVIRHNTTLDNRVIDCIPRGARYGVVQLQQGGFMRAGVIELYAQKIIQESPNISEISTYESLSLLTYEQLGRYFTYALLEG